MAIMVSLIITIVVAVVIGFTIITMGLRKHECGIQCLSRCYRQRVYYQKYWQLKIFRQGNA